MTAPTVVALFLLLATLSGTGVGIVLWTAFKPRYGRNPGTPTRRRHGGFVDHEAAAVERLKARRGKP